MKKWITPLILCSSALAGDVTLSWNVPTRSEQCTVLPDTPPDLAGYQIWQLIAEIDDPSQTSYVISGLESGEYFYAMTASITNGAQSRVSDRVSKVVEPLKVIDERAYVLAKIDNGILTSVAGTVPLDTACNEDIKVGDFYVVPVEAVTWTGTVRDIMVLAKCG